MGVSFPRLSLSLAACRAKPKIKKHQKLARGVGGGGGEGVLPKPKKTSCPDERAGWKRPRRRRGAARRAPRAREALPHAPQSGGDHERGVRVPALRHGLLGRSGGKNPRPKGAARGEVWTLKKVHKLGTAKKMAQVERRWWPT